MMLLALEDGDSSSKQKWQVKWKGLLCAMYSCVFSYQWAYIVSYIFVTPTPKASAVLAVLEQWEKKTLKDASSNHTWSGD